MTILCATDFSPCAETAVQLASALGRRTGSPLLVVHAVEPPALDLLARGERVWEDALKKAAETRLKSLFDRLRRAGRAVETRTLVGDPAKAILATAKEADAELIVLGTHGRQGAARLFMGSVAEKIARSGCCPVLITRASGAESARWEAQEPIRLVVAVDGTAAANSALAWTKRLAERVACDLSIVRVFWPAQEAERYGLDEAWDGGRATSAVEPLLRRELGADAERLIGGTARIRLAPVHRDMTETLMIEVERLNPDALVIGLAKGHPGMWTGLAPGLVVRGASVPVFCIPQGPTEATGAVKPTRAVLAATDLSDSSRAAVGAACGLLSSGGRIEICYVHERGKLVAPAEAYFEAPLADEERRRIEGQLRALVPREVTELGIKPTVHVIEGRTAAEAILQAAERLDVDVIAVASHGRSGVPRAVLGSVAEEVARRSPGPVLIARASAPTVLPMQLTDSRRSRP